MQMGLREANQNFFKAIKAVKSGAGSGVDRAWEAYCHDKPLKVMQNSDAVVRRLEAAGLLRPAQKTSPVPAWSPRPLKGGPLSRTLREERDLS
jgi:hypothetical protein